jgi:hypothetical protein
LTWHPIGKTSNVKWQETRAWADQTHRYRPPAIQSPAWITRDDLYLSIGRMLALASARRPLVRGLQLNARRMIDLLVDSRPQTLTAMTDIGDLADQGLVQFAHDMAVGVAAICMNDAGFIWLDHAKQLLPGSKRRPDYVWSAGQPNGGVVLSEVKGMASSKPFGSLRSRTERAYKEQIRDWAADHTLSGAPILGGYAIGVHIPAGRPSGIAVLRSQPLSASSDSDSPGRIGPPLTLARGHYRAALTLIGATSVANQLLPRPRLQRLSPGQSLDLVVADGQPFVMLHDEAPAPRPALAYEAFQFARALAQGEVETHSEDEAYDVGLSIEFPDKLPIEPSIPLVEPPRFADLYRSIAKGRGRSAIVAFAPDGLALLDRRHKLEVVDNLRSVGTKLSSRHSP